MEAADDAEDEIIDFTLAGDKKKKKKKDKDKKGKFDEAAAEEDEEGGIVVKKKEKVDLAALNRVNLNEAPGHEPFTYREMLEKIIKLVQSQKSDEDGSGNMFRLIEP